MSRYSSYDRGYESDDSTLVNERRRGGRSRYRSPSADSESPRRPSYYDDGQSEKERGSSDGTKKAAIAVGLLAAVAGLLHIWSAKRRAEQEHEDRRRRRKAFERAKVARRKEESRRERQRQQHWEAEAEPQEEVRRIGYMPSKARSRSRPRMIEQGPSELDDGDDSDEEQQRYESTHRQRRTG